MVIDHIREAPCGHLEEHFEISDNFVSIIKTGREEANYKEIEYFKQRLMNTAVQTKLLREKLSKNCLPVK